VELNSELLFELLEFEASKILGEDISSVIFGGDMIQHNLFDRYALTHIMIFYINMFGADFLHSVTTLILNEYRQSSSSSVLAFKF
jgi:hypothetical protein